MNKKPVLLFDAECTMCKRFQKALEMIDVKKVIKYVSIYDENIYIEFPFLSKDDCEGVIHLVDTDLKVYRGGEVISFLAKTYPGVKKFSWLLDSDSSKRALDLFYNRVSESRKTKRGCSTCGGKHKHK